jgi:DNA polymerase III gamma/tau subunit
MSGGVLMTASNSTAVVPAPCGFSDIVGQDLVVAVLRSRLCLNEKLDRHLTFAGPPGAGKRAMALLYAQSLVCDARRLDGSPCQACIECLGIRGESSFAYVKIDAAFQGDDETVRTILERDDSLNMARVRVVVIDNAERLTMSGADTALKTLERETKSVFLFLANDLKAFSGALRSRCHVFHVRPADEDVLVDHLAAVCSQHAISYERAALYIIARSAQGLCGTATDMLTTVAKQGDVVVSRTLEALGLDWAPVMQRCWTATFAGLYEEAFAESEKLGTNGPQRIRAMQAFLLDLELRSIMESANHCVHPALNLISDAEWKAIARLWERAAEERGTDVARLIQRASKFWCSVGADGPWPIAFRKAYELFGQIGGRSSLDAVIRA